MKKILFAFLIVLLSASLAFAAAGQDKEGAGYYKHSVTGAIKYFDSHPGEPSQWTLVGPTQPPVTPPGCGGSCDKIAIGYYSAGADGHLLLGKFDSSLNDFAMTGGWDNSFAVNFNLATDKWFAGQAGFAEVDTHLCSWAFTYDKGLESGSFAMSKITSEVKAGGATLSDNGIGRTKCPDESTSFTLAKGTAFQMNGAGELGWSGANAVAWNASEASFKEFDFDKETGGYISSSYAHADGSAMTVGFSKVKVDPFGPYRSSWGETGNFGFGNDGVKGVGLVQTEAFNGGAYATGMSSFSYQAPTFGGGYATNTSIVNVGGSSYSAKSFGYSVSGSVGNNYKSFK